MIPVTKSQKISVIAGLILISVTNVILVRLSCSQDWEYLPAFAYAGVFFGLLVAYYLQPFCLWEKMVVFFVAGCIVAARGFVYIGIPLGEIFVPIGEMIVFSALILICHSKSRPSFFKEKVSWWIFGWLAYGMLRLLIAMPEIQFITLKSSCMIYYSLFIYFGYGLACRKEAVDRFFKILGPSFLLLLFHCLFYSPNLGSAWSSPRVCHGISLFGSFGSSCFNAIGACFFFMIVAKHYIRWPQWIYVILAATFLALTVFLQVRSGFVALAAAIIITMLWSDIRQKIKLGNLIILSVFAFIIVTSLIGIQIKGGRGPVRPDYLIMQLKSIFGISDSTFQPSSFDGEYISSKGLMGTRQGRIRIWKGIISDNLRSPTTALLGKGFREPLLNIKLSPGRAPKRSPHNGYVLIFGYLGFIGLSLFLMFNLLFVKRIIKAIRLNKSEGRQKESDTLLWVFVYYAVMVIGALATPIFGTPYMAPIFYFLIGLGLSLSSQSEAVCADAEFA